MLLKSKIAKALSSECRILLLGWLSDPDTHFKGREILPRRRSAVAIESIEQKWNVGNATARSHIWRLKSAGLVTVERAGGSHWISRNDPGIAQARKAGHLYVR